MNNFFSRFCIGSRKHVTDGELLAFMDGEARIGQARTIRIHLEACWSCRRRYEQIQTTIFEFMDYRKQLTARYMPPPSSGRVQFLAMLDNERARTRPSWCARILNRLRSWVFVMHPALSACLIVVGVAVTLLVSLRNPTTVSAGELLKKAEAAETHFNDNRRHILVSQRIRLSSPTSNFECMLYRDSEGRRHPRSSVLNRADSEVKRRLEVAGIDGQQPISATSFQRWHDGLSEKQDTVSEDNTSVTLQTSSTSSTITQASLTVRKIDFHPTRRRIVFRDFGAIEISELAYDVSDWSEGAAASLFEPDPAPLPVTAALPKLVGPPPALPLPIDLDEAELRALLALNDANADSGEQIVIRQSQSSIQVTGIVETKRRKHELEEALQGLPLVNTRLQSLEEGSQRLAATSSRSPVQEYSTAHESRLQTYLESRSQRPGQIAQFSHEFLEATLDVQRQAHALDSLNGQFPAAARSNLSQDGSAMLNKLERRHRESLRTAIKRERTLVEQWVEPGPPQPKSPDEASYVELRLEADRNKELSDELLSTSEANRRAANEIMADLRDSIQRLDAIVTDLTRNVQDRAR